MPCNLSDYLGKEFEMGGRGPDRYDCYGLCYEICRLNDHEMPSFRTPADWMAAYHIMTLEKERFVRLEKPKPFCLVAFSLKRNLVTHVGVVLDDLTRFIHIMKNRRVAIERLNNMTWKNKGRGFYWYAGN